MSDPFNLDRFVAAQEPLLADVMVELDAGRKRTHWMWFVFPQLRGLGSSSMATFYGIGSIEEAREYLAHPLLGPRLKACTRAVLAHADRSLLAIFGTPDDMKFRSSMTLFSAIDPDGSGLFQEALDRFSAGERDERTVALMQTKPD